MSRAGTDIVISIRFAWWVKPYLQSIQLFSLLTGLQADPEKVSATVIRGVRLKLEK